MFEDVLDACLSQGGWETWVVSHDEAVLDIGIRRGARPIAEKGTSLRDAVRQTELEVTGASSQLGVVLADLPLITAEAVSEALARTAAVVAVPAASDGGTNLLLRRPPPVIPARFGRSSFAKHRWAARRARVHFEDVHLPEDLARVLAEGGKRRTRSACLEMGVPERLRVRATGP